MANGNNTVPPTDPWLTRMTLFFTLLTSVIVTVFGFINKDKIDETKQTVDNKTTQVIENQEDAKVRDEKTKARQEKTAEDLKKELEEQQKREEERDLAIGSQLYGNWRYLEDIGDTAKAKEAKKIYEDFKRSRSHVRAKLKD